MRRLTNLLMAGLLAGSVILAAGCSKKEEPKPVIEPPRVSAPAPKPRISFADSVLAEGKYAVEQNNKLYDIAQKVYGTPGMAYAIADWNGINMWQIDGSYKANIRPGDSLVVKKVNVMYVKPGDSWWSIARNVGLNIEEAQEKFHWIGQTPNPGEVYYLDNNEESNNSGKNSEGYGSQVGDLLGSLDAPDTRPVNYSCGGWP